jgi:hypothetical protein
MIGICIYESDPGTLPGQRKAQDQRSCTLTGATFGVCDNDRWHGLFLKVRISIVPRMSYPAIKGLCLPRVFLPFI